MLHTDALVEGPRELKFRSEIVSSCMSPLRGSLWAGLDFLSIS